jgi:hypothetical protein
MREISQPYQRSGPVVHNGSRCDPQAHHRVMPSLSTAIGRTFHFPARHPVLTCVPRMRDTRHPETGPKRSRNPPGPARPGSPKAKAAQGQRPAGTRGISRPNLRRSRSLRCERRSKASLNNDSMSHWMDTVRRRSDKAANQDETPLKRGFSFSAPGKLSARWLSRRPPPSSRRRRVPR